MTQVIKIDENGQHIAKRQYLHPGDGDVTGMFWRIARWIAGAEVPEVQEHWAQKYFDLMAEKKFCPGGRVLAGAGTQHGNVLNCFVQGATEHAPSSFEGVMEVAKKLALVTKVGGGNGVNLDVYPARVTRKDTVQGVAYLRADHPDVDDFLQGLMRPPTQPDGDKQPVKLRNWKRVVYGEGLSEEQTRRALQHQVELRYSRPEHVTEVPDDMGGIMDAAAQVTVAVREGDTPHLDLSLMRAEGTPIKGSGGTSSGPVSFLAEIFDNFVEWGNLGAERSGPVHTLRYVYAPVLRVVRQGGSRRGAGMATISIGHPDVLDFLTAKDLDREAAEGDIGTFNISILVSAAFWDAVQQDALWPLAPQEVPGKYVPVLNSKVEHVGDLRAIPVQTTPQGLGVRARWLWGEIAQHAWQTGEPGLIFNDRVNEHSALKNLGDRYEIRSTNPCLAPGTLVYYREVGSDDGPRSAPVEQLLDRDVEVIDGVDNCWYVTRFRVTGRNEVVWNLETDHGGTDHFTPYHTFFLEDGTPVQLRELEEGQKLLAGNGNLFTVLAVGTESRMVAEVYCCTVEPHHRFTLASGLQSGNCGEIPLTVGEPCDLGAINLSEYVTDGTFDMTSFRADVRTCVRFLDDLLDVNVFALEDNRVASQDLRRLGLGVMGLADALIKMGLAYDSDEGRAAVHEMMTALREAAVAESEALGEEKGVYPVYARHQALMPHRPRRNVAVLTVAPTGTTSMLMGASSGLEPLFSPFIWRRIGGDYRPILHPLFRELMEETPLTRDELREAQQGHYVVRNEHDSSPRDFLWDWEKVQEAISSNHGSVQGLSFIPERIRHVIRCAHDIHPSDHVRMQAVVQRAYDAGGEHAANSISKTINLPNNATVQDVERAYDEAYRSGCKGVTVYRDGCRSFQPLNTSKQAAEGSTPEPAAALEGAAVPGDDVTAAGLDGPGDLNAPPTDVPPPPGIAPSFTRQTKLQGSTIMMRLRHMDTGVQTTYLVTVNTDHVTGLPIEVLLVGGSSGQEAHADSEAIGRAASNALQFGTPARKLIKTFKGIEGGLMGYVTLPDGKNRRVTSKADLVAYALEESLRDRDERLRGLDRALQAPLSSAVPEVVHGAPAETLQCPSCDSMALKPSEGCYTCEACGYSRCS
ncbi:ribonucleotide reductase N-terminal alpha domain-containing protein [Deinococcus ficus]|uniref:Ribonucleoside-diphosphate reductase n=1 Tax=Deinococcus ficus TaxID=317577 RepID=A0A221T2X1_9DEIO|nr:ribonucleotide reductase N-terminal alpha domain-containing protein [Deinococcus ficus]ASN83196.1 hypothetical protein DFI_18525 [Deinococcus ficus]